MGRGGVDWKYGKMERWKDGKMGRWGDGKCCLKFSIIKELAFLVFSSSFLNGKINKQVKSASLIHVVNRNK